MPVMTGLEAMHVLRNDPDTSDIPVVLTTGSLPPPDVTGVLGDGDRVLIKPYSPAELRAAVDTAATSHNG
jgi:CheY-like chemotaxis protein